MKTQYILDNQELTIHSIMDIISSQKDVVLSERIKLNIQKCRDYLDDVVNKGDKQVYGINTGFGSLCDTAISEENLEQLQTNLVLSHACGMGKEVPADIVKIMLLLKAIGLSYGHSGAQVETIERLLFFFNNNILPVVYQQGSLGASGDLAPLAHLALPILGEGEVKVAGERMSARSMEAVFNIHSIRLRSKEGLALLNGTQFMSSYALYSVFNAKQIIDKSMQIAALSLDAYDGRVNPFQSNVNKVRKQLGQIAVAERMRELIGNSEIAQQEKAHVQDPYSFRCIPQVLGASLDAIHYVEQIVEREINAVTDNPTVFPDENDVVSAGNFHGQPLAISMDFLAIAVAEIGSISERRVYKLIGGTRELPAFLVANPGLNSGFMIPQYSAASVVSQNKQLCSPASVDTIDSSNGQEDHVSMGANAATKLYQVVENVYKVLGVELMNAAQAIEFRRPLKSSDKTEELLSMYRKHVPFVKEDKYLQPLISKSIRIVKKEMSWKNI